MKIRLGIISFFAMGAAFCLPTTVAKAGPGPAALLHVSFCGTQFYFATDDYPSLYIDSVDVYDSRGTLVTNVDVDGHNAEWRDAGFPIGRVAGHWGVLGNGVMGYTVDSNTPACAGEKLIDMYVYYSGSPFFGGTHTLTIYSAMGFPSKSVVTELAGGRLPDGFEYGAPTCWGALSDNGTDEGVFACDGFLAGVGERRACLRNDPEGPDFDLLPKIEKYFDMLDEINRQ
jgi:hypothetical protein